MTLSVSVALWSSKMDLALHSNGAVMYLEVVNSAKGKFGYNFMSCGESDGNGSESKSYG